MRRWGTSCGRSSEVRSGGVVSRTRHAVDAAAPMNVLRLCTLIAWSGGRGILGVALELGVGLVVVDHAMRRRLS